VVVAQSVVGGSCSWGDALDAVRAYKAASILKRHWRLFPIAWNLLVILLGMAFIVLSLFDGSPASRKYVACMVMISMQFIPCSNDLLHHVDEYKKSRNLAA
jgi:hypothetical protein